MDGKYANKKLFNTIREIPTKTTEKLLNTYWNDSDFKKKKKLTIPDSERIQSNSNSLLHSLLMGMQNGKPLWKSLAASHKVKYMPKIRPSNPAPGYLSKRNEDI